MVRIEALRSCSNATEIIGWSGPEVWIGGGRHSGEPRAAAQQDAQPTGLPNVAVTCLVSRASAARPGTQGPHRVGPGSPLADARCGRDRRQSFQVALVHEPGAIIDRVIRDELRRFHVVEHAPQTLVGYREVARQYVHSYRVLERALGISDRGV